MGGGLVLTTAIRNHNVAGAIVYYGGLPNPVDSLSGIEAPVLAFFGDDESSRANELEKVLKNLRNLDYSVVFFIPASKINFYISKFKNYFFDRKILIAKEMTKIYEDFIRGKVVSIKTLPENLKGEFTIVISEKNKEKKIKKEINESIKIEIKRMLKKYSHKDVVEFISKKEDLPKKIVYDFCLKLKK